MLPVTFNCKCSCHPFYQPCAPNLLPLQRCSMVLWTFCCHPTKGIHHMWELLQFAFYRSKNPINTLVRFLCKWGFIFLLLISSQTQSSFLEEWKPNQKYHSLTIIGQDAQGWKGCGSNQEWALNQCYMFIQDLQMEPRVVIPIAPHTDLTKFNFFLFFVF